MNQFFLNLLPEPQQKTITHNKPVVLFGSCFVENIGQKLSYYKFQASTNPFGIIFHPEAISILIERIALKKEFTENDLFFHNELWHCFEIHSKWSSNNKVELLNNLNATLKEYYTKIKKASHFIITYGTAWGYIKNSTVVANCYKLPKSSFTKKLSSVDSLKNTFSNTFNNILSINPTITIIATVSPVRHIKDGIIENSQSKANLITALHQIIASNKEVKYYPAYELVLDCLRDYRFYKDDLVHPNETAINYVWEHFCETYIYQPETKAISKKVQEIQRGLLHKPFNPNSEAHQKFINDLNKKKQLLLKKYPFLEF